MLKSCVPGIGALLALAVLAIPGSASAKAGEVGRRRGGQLDAVFGVSGCMAGPAACSLGDASSRPPGPLFGTAANIGWRAHPHFFLGVGYSLGFFGPSSTSPTGYNRAYQNSVVAVIRGYLPADRFDFGFELSPGWSRVTFRADRTKSFAYSEGFVLRPAVSSSYWISEHLFLGIRFESLINMHHKLCNVSGSRAVCDLGDRGRRGSVSTFVGGVHIGGTFGRPVPVK